MIVPASGSIDVRARALADRIAAVARGRRVNLIGFVLSEYNYKLPCKTLTWWDSHSMVKASNTLTCVYLVIVFERDACIY
jgi:hypothetical protein